MKNDLKKDWRLHGQENYLKGVRLIRHKYQIAGRVWDHDHCDFCGAKFSTNEGDLHFGYSTIDSYYWSCKIFDLSTMSVDNWNDFKNMFKWIVE